jgi:hypothetical protein
MITTTIHYHHALPPRTTMHHHHHHPLVRTFMPSVLCQVWITAKGINPFGSVPIHKLNTPGRMLVWSRQAVQLDIAFAEELKLFDDYYPFIQVFEIAVQNRLRVFGVNDSEIYLYNQLGDSTATKR